MVKLSATRYYGDMDLFKQAQTYHFQGQFHEAKKCYEACLCALPTHSEALHGLGLLHVQLSEYDTALLYLKEAITLSPTTPTLHNHLGNVLKKCGRMEEALQAFHEALRLLPDYSDALNNAGNVYFAQLYYQEALIFYQKALALKPHHTEALYNQGLCQVKLEQGDAALHSFQTLLKNTGEHFGAHYQLGVLHFKQGAYAKAITHFRAALFIHPSHMEAHMNIGHAHLRNNTVNEALLHYQYALDLDNNNVEAHYNLAHIALDKNNLDLAISHYLQVIRIAPHHFAAHNNVGIAFIKKNAKSLALKHLLQAQALESHHVSLNYSIKALQNSTDIESAPTEYIKALFDNYAEHFDTHILSGLEYTANAHCHRALQTITQLPHKKWCIADLGCGTGLCGPFFKPHAATLIGIDLSPNMLQKAREKNMYDALIEADIQDYLTQHPHHFDCLVAADVLVYTGNIDPILKAAAMALKPHGFFVFSVEIATNADFCITPSGRYAHSAPYLLRVAQENGFMSLLTNTETTRLQFGKEVKGFIVVLKKT